MRFADLRLKTYGGFQDRVLTFPSSETDFHIVLGANEAGKTTALRALSALLFGFGHLTEDAYLFDARDLRVGATLEDGAGNPLCVYRKRGRVRTLVNEADELLPDECLVPYLNGVEQNFFELVFGLNHERLRQGGQELAENRGDLAESLFAAGAGIGGLRGTLTGLREEADELFKARGQNPAINAALREHQDALRLVHDSSIGVTAWKNLYDEHGRALKRQEKLNAEVLRESEHVTRLERIQHNLPQLERRRMLLEQLAGLADVPDMREDQVDSRKTAQDNARDAEKALARTKEDIGRLEADLTDIQVDEALLAHEEDVEDIRNDRTLMQATMKDLPGVQAKNDLIRGRIAELLKDATLAADVDSVTGGLPGSPELNNLRALVREHQSLSEARNQLAGAHLDTQMDLERERETLATLPPQIETATLQDSVDGVVDEGPLDRELETARNDITGLEQVLAQRGAALRPWQYEPDELTTLQLPSIATVEAYEERFDLLGGGIDKAEQKILEAQAEADDNRADLEVMAAGQDVPTPEAVEDARRVREEVWSLLRRGFIDGNEDVSTEAKSYDSSRALPEAYEHQVAQADELSDRRYAEAERIANHQAATVQLDKVQKRLVRLERQLAGMQSQHEQVQVEWEAEWEALDGEPRSPAEMRAWLTARGQILDTWKEVVAVRERIQQLEARISEARESLAVGLEMAGLPRAEHPDGLAALLKRARKLLQTASEFSVQRQAITERIGLLERQAASAEERIKANEKDTKAWLKQWGAAVKAVERDAKATPAEIEAVIERIEQIGQLEIERKQHEVRIEEMQTFILQYQERAKALAKAVAPDLATGDPLEVVSRLGAALDESRKAHDRREQLGKNLQRQQDTQREAVRNAEEAQRELEGLFAELGCTDMEGLLELESQADEKRRLQADFGELKTALIEGNPGHSIEEVVAEAGEVNVDALPGQLVTLRTELEVLQEQQREAAEMVGRLRGDLERMDGNDRAAQAQQTAEEKLAVIESAAVRYIRAEVAWLLVKRTIERYQEQNQGPLLARAGEIFREITLESFEGLTVEHLDTGPVLLGSRPNGKSLLLEQMSDGTRDQLFLSIRLAAIERHMQQRGPLPVILDDILVNFDDDRSAATLRLLADLSRHTQIIFLSHHPHLVTLAEQHLGEYTPNVQLL